MPAHFCCVHVFQAAYQCGLAWDTLTMNGSCMSWNLYVFYYIVVITVCAEGTESESFIKNLYDVWPFFHGTGVTKCTISDCSFDQKYSQMSLYKNRTNNNTDLTAEILSKACKALLVEAQQRKDLEKPFHLCEVDCCYSFIQLLSNNDLQFLLCLLKHYQTGVHSTTWANMMHQQAHTYST